MKCHDCKREIIKPETGCGMGYATLREPPNAHVCYNCAELATADVFGCYVSSDGKHLTTWTGGVLARVTSEVRRSGGGFHYGSLWYYNAVAPDGSLWYGKGAGRGMCLKIRRSKARKAA